MKHTISVLVENKPGVLARISGLFSARGFNIESLAVGETHDPSISRLTMVVNAAEERILEQIKKQLHKLIDVITVWDLTNIDFFERELVLLKVDLNILETGRFDSVVNDFKLNVLSRDDREAVIEFAGDQDRIHELSVILDAGVKELVRTGRIAISR